MFILEPKLTTDMSTVFFIQILMPLNFDHGLKKLFIKKIITNYYLIIVREYLANLFLCIFNVNTDIYWHGRVW